MKNLTKDQQPHSDDPDFWDVWTRKYADGKLVERTVDWEAVVKEWQQKWSAAENESGRADRNWRNFMPSIYLVLRSIVPPPMTTEVAANAVPNNLNINNELTS